MVRRLAYLAFAAAAVKAVRIDDEDVPKTAEEVREAVKEAGDKAEEVAAKGGMSPGKAAKMAADAVEEAGGSHDDIDAAVDDSADAAAERNEKNGLIEVSMAALEKLAKKTRTDVDEDVVEEVKHRFDATEASTKAARARAEAAEKAREAREAAAEKKAAALQEESDAEAKKIVAMGKTQAQALRIRDEKIAAEKQAILEAKEAALASGRAAAKVVRMQGKCKEEIGHAAYAAVLEGGGSESDAAHLAIEETAFEEKKEEPKIIVADGEEAEETEETPCEEISKASEEISKASPLQQAPDPLAKINATRGVRKSSAVASVQAELQADLDELNNKPPVEEASSLLEVDALGKETLAKYLEITMKRIMDTNPSAADLAQHLEPGIVGNINRLSQGAPNAQLLATKTILTKYKVTPSFEADKKEFLAALKELYSTVMPTIDGPCECMKEFGYVDGKLYKGCSETPDWEGHQWCYVVGGTKCPVAKDSHVTGEVRKFRECKPKTCHCPWKTTPVVSKTAAEAAKATKAMKEIKATKIAKAAAAGAEASGAAGAAGAAEEPCDLDTNSSMLESSIDPEDQCVCLPPGGPGGKTFYGRMKEPLPEDEEPLMPGEEPAVAPKEPPVAPKDTEEPEPAKVEVPAAASNITLAGNNTTKVEAAVNESTGNQ